MSLQNISTLYLVLIVSKKKILPVGNKRAQLPQNTGKAFPGIGP